MIFPSTREFLRFIPSTRSGRAGPLLSGLQKVGKDRRKGVSPPCGSPLAGRWTPPFGPNSRAGVAELLAASRLELCRWGKRERVASPRPPHLHRFVCGLRPLAPCVPQRGTSGSCAPALGASPLAPVFPKGKSSPIMRASAWYRVRNGFCSNAFANLRGSSCREAARSSVTPLARLCRRHSSATASGESQRGRSPLGQSLPTFCWPESRGLARPERVEGKK